MPFITYGAGFITTINDPSKKQVYHILNARNNSSIVLFKIVTRRYFNNKPIHESIDCKKFIAGDPSSFCSMLKEKTMVFISGTLEQYTPPDSNETKYSVNCQVVDFCGKIETDNSGETNG